MQSSDKKYSGLRLGIFALLSASAIIAAVAVYLTTGKTFEEVAEEAAADRQAALQDAAGDGVGPSFDVVRISRGGTGVIAGRAAPGSSVEVYADDELVGTATADQNGEWVMILEEPLQSGPAELSILAKRDGEEATESEDIVVVSVPDRPDEDRFLEETGDGVVAVLTPRDGVGASRILQRPGAGPVGEIGDSLAIETLDYAPDGSAYMSGRGLPRALPGSGVRAGRARQRLLRARDRGAEPGGERRQPALHARRPSSDRSARRTGVVSPASRTS